ncbi:MAG: sulfurtransferase [Sphingobium sp.]
MRHSRLIDASTLAALIARDAVMLFDCGFDLADPGAGEAAYRAGHLPGAQYLHLDAHLSGPMTGDNGRHPLPDPEVFADTLRRAGLRRGQQVVAYDAAGGPYAARLWWLLRWIGHDAVAVLDGGIQAWIAAGGALESGTAAARGDGDFRVETPGAQATVDAAMVGAGLERRDVLLVDARAPERFAGQPHPLDRVAGHIPGAVNRFFKDNLAEDGRFKAPDILAAEWRALLGERSASNAVMQCGSGVTACHNLLALAAAGMEGARLYPGSWSEWTADPARPVAVGGA